MAPAIHRTFHTLTAATVALLALGVFAPAQAQAATQGTVIIQSGTPERVYQTAPSPYQVIPAPPPPRNEAMPRERRGQVWQEGHWEWRGQQHVWVRGQWLKARDGYGYRQPQWVERDGRWEMQRGGWDRDGDGVPNRQDRDRDGDGVPNRQDRNPDNPRRH